MTEYTDNRKIQAFRLGDGEFPLWFVDRLNNPNLGYKTAYHGGEYQKLYKITWPNKFSRSGIHTVAKIGDWILLRNSRISVMTDGNFRKFYSPVPEYKEHNMSNDPYDYSGDYNDDDLGDD